MIKQLGVRNAYQALFTLAIAAIITLAMAQTSSAAVIYGVKGKKVYLKLHRGDQFKSGQIVNTYNKDGKPMAKIKIVKVGKTRAIGFMASRGQFSKGTIVKAWTPASDSKTISSTKNGKYVVGGQVGYQIDSTVIDNSTDTKKTLPGTGFSVKGFIDIPIMPWLEARGAVGLQQLNGEESSKQNCADSNANAESCNINVNYLSMDLIGKVVFGKGNFIPWAGPFAQFMFPISKDTNAIADDSIKSTSFFGVAFGADWHISGGKHIIPLQIEYGLYPPSEQVNSNSIILKAGYGFNW